MSDVNTLSDIKIILSEVVVPKLKNLEGNQQKFLKNDHESPCDTSKSAHKRIDKLNVVLIAGLIILLAGMIGIAFSNIRPVI